jgi:signal peptidase I
MTTIEDDLLIDDDLLGDGSLLDALRTADGSPPPPRRSRGRRIARVVSELALTVGALLGVAIAVLTVVAAQSGFQPLVVRSGSMEPTIATGSMILTEEIDASEIRVGDVVAVERPDHTRVTHRVVSVVAKGEAVELVLKGDANEDPDPVPVTVRHAHRLAWQAPMIGRTLAWLATAPGGFLLGCIVTTVTGIAAGARPARRRRCLTRRSGRRTSHHG